MSTAEPLIRLMGINNKKLSKEQFFILEGELFIRICDAIKEFFRNRFISYFQLLNFTKEMENAMLDANYIRFAIDDILSTEEYTLSGIAYYTNIPEEVLHEILSGSNARPSATFLQKVIELHRSVKPELYTKIIKNIIAEYKI